MHINPGPDHQYNKPVVGYGGRSIRMLTLYGDDMGRGGDTRLLLVAGALIVHLGLRQYIGQTQCRHVRYNHSNQFQ